MAQLASLTEKVIKSEIILLLHDNVELGGISKNVQYSNNVFSKRSRESLCMGDRIFAGISRSVAGVCAVAVR